MKTKLIAIRTPTQDELALLRVLTVDDRLKVLLQASEAKIEQMKKGATQDTGKENRIEQVAA